MQDDDPIPPDGVREDAGPSPRAAAPAPAGPGDRAVHRFSVGLGKDDALRAVRDLHALLDAAFPGELVVVGRVPAPAGAGGSGPVHAIVDADAAPAGLLDRLAPRTAVVLASAPAGTRVEVRVPAAERVLEGLGTVVETALRALSALPGHESGDAGRREAAIRRAFAAPEAPGRPEDGAGAPPGFVARFESLAERHPDRPALHTPDGTVSYGELARRTGALAAALRERAPQAGARVLVLPRRGPELVTAFVAALKAGLAVSLVDPRHPDGYIDACAAVLGPALVIDLAGRAGTPAAGAPVMDERELAAAAGADPPHPASGPEPFGPDDCAIVTFTSGTTGEPKAVAGRYSSLGHFYDWMDARFGPLADLRFGLCSSLGHDPLQRDIMTPLYLGGAVAIPGEGVLDEPARLAEWLRRERIGAVCLNPVLIPSLTGSGADLPELRLYLSVGSPLTRDQALRLRRAAPAARILNLYGSTETQRAVSYFEVPGTAAEIAALPAVVPLGRGMRDAVIGVAAPGGGAPRLPFETGEITLSSEHISLGYLNSPELAAERFRAAAPGRPLPTYLTGDLGYLSPSLGVISSGRADGQVKIAGYRVETDEVSAACRAHPQAADAVTVMVEADGLPTLAAFVVPADPALEFAAAGFRAFLQGRLPHYAVPQHIITLPAVPMTLNRKIDFAELRRRARLRIDGAEPAARGGDPVLDFVRRHTGMDAPPDDVPLLELGVDSLRFMSIASRLADGPAGRRALELSPAMSLAEVRAALDGAPEPPAAPPRRAPQGRAAPPRPAAAAALGPVTRVSNTSITFGTRTFAHCCSNDYLGLGTRNAGPAALDEFWASGLPPHSHGSAEVNAYTVWHESLADALRELHGTEAAVLFSSAYLANTTAIAAVAGPGDHLFVDESAHRSILDGCLLSGARLHVFGHNDLEELDRLLSEAAAPGRRRAVVTEGLFGVEGDIADLPALHRLAERHGCLLIVDEACSLGQLGPSGRGAAEHFGALDTAAHLRVGTLAKTLGSSGGYATGPRELIDRIRPQRGAAFSTGLSPIHAFLAHRAARTLLDEGAVLAERLRVNAGIWRNALRAAGLAIGGTQSAIVPLVFAGPEEAERHHAALLAAGVYGVRITPPWSGTVNAVRTTVTAAHDHGDILRLAARVGDAVAGTGGPGGVLQASSSAAPETGG
ncbi:aminotransferase class I/II-fold pyridoxal phosphate-dependent enzyme [Allonocardiopsis opalescens]|uniref:7-keto-8-aminopelargonate synthetase-like enzyme n=1 Tax=Allonocardiopsis opalescens TaxID=1144618 RepID=A0A2T0PYP3_9ACTN|nr:aminotransferase class I/II-fold pyridoxal phosphate-dependent enzyme [Allonocardiopsis opalescens]PRX96638.1 7-keto-8-aminopelargonate synthetase-like enzyme [Allonocardiopsis opalescens]